jgi:hypothetical protein
MPINEHNQNPQAGHERHGHTPDTPGYETTDVNVNGIVVFLSGLAGSLIIFFVFCWVMGKAINGAYAKMDGAADKWHEAEGGGMKGLTSNPELQQQKLQQLSQAFPEPRVDLDDGNQQIADIHAREDLMLEHYSRIPGENFIRIPIERAMDLVAQRGLPVHAAPAGEMKMAGDVEPQITTPLTNGFARTGYEQSVIEAREQKMNFGRAEAAAHAELAPAK